MIKTRHILTTLLLLAMFIGKSQEYGSFTDPRDGLTYKTVTVEIKLPGDVTVKRTWMAENLRHEIKDGSFCYNNEPAYCEAYGRLYTFKAAVEACPEGWHVPTIGEWRLLWNSFGGIHEAGIALQKGGKSGMELIPGGFGDPGSVFKNIGISGNYWDAEKKSDNTSGLVSVQKGSKEIYHSVIGDWHRNSCRCTKD